MEQIIIELPPKIIKVRTMELYPIDEAYKILRQIGAISCNFEFAQKILHGHHVFSQKAGEWLRNTIGEMGSKAQFCTVLYCELYVFPIGFMRRKLLLVDAHPVNRDLGVDGNGLLKVLENCSPKACGALCACILKRLRTGGGLTKKAEHSFVVMSPEER